MSSATVLAVAQAPKIYPARDLVDRLGCSTTNQASELLGLSYSGVDRWLRDGRKFTEAEAELWAAKLGAHPCEIWHDLWWEMAPA